MGGCGWLRVHVRVVFLLVHDRRGVRVLDCGGGGLVERWSGLCGASGMVGGLALLVGL